MNKFERHSYLYSSWVALFVPCILSLYVGYDYIGSIAVIYDSSMNIVNKIIPASFMIAFYAAVGFYLRNTFRLTSRHLFQYRLFKEDETEMPTTQILLYADATLPDETKDRVREKVYEKFNFKMKNREEERNDLLNAKKCIIQAVKYMRNATREDPILVQSNYRYGFQRNQLGGLVWSSLFCIVLLLISAFTNSGYTIVSLCALLAVALQGVGAYFMMKDEAKTYADTLISSFLSY